MNPLTPSSDAKLFAEIIERLERLERAQRQVSVGSATMAGSATGVPVPAASPAMLPVLHLDVPKSGRVLVALSAAASWGSGSFRLRPALTDTASVRHESAASLAPLWDGAGLATPAPRSLVTVFDGLPPGPAIVALDTLGVETVSGAVDFNLVVLAAVNI